MTVLCVVQARMGSTRRPGKVLADLGGRPLLAHLLDRLSPLGAAGVVGQIVVATSEASGDDAVATVAQQVGVETVRGPEHDVLARFGVVLDRHPAEVVVRITGDCPFVDPELVAAALRLRAETAADYASNTLARTYPDGFDVEVVTSEALQRADIEARDPVEREHVTPFVYRRPSTFALRTLRHDGASLAHLRCTVDVEEDLESARELIRRLGRDDAGWLDVVGAMDTPPPRPFRLDPVGPDDGDRLLALRNEDEAVRWSLSGAQVDPDRHADWFRSLLGCPARRAWLGRAGGDVVGLVRIDVDDGIGLVSLAVEASQRGRGFGRQLLADLMRELEADQQVRMLRAEIRHDNIASRRTFAAAGFTEQGDVDGVVTTTRMRGTDGFGR